MIYYQTITTFMNNKPLTAYIPNKNEVRPVSYGEECMVTDVPDENGNRWKTLKKGWFVNIRKGDWQKIKGSALAKEHGEHFLPENIKIQGYFTQDVERIFKEAF